MDTRGFTFSVPLALGLHLVLLPGGHVLSSSSCFITGFVSRCWSGCEGKHSLLWLHFSLGRAQLWLWSFYSCSAVEVLLHLTSPFSVTASPSLQQLVGEKGSHLADFSKFPHDTVWAPLYSQVVQAESLHSWEEECSGQFGLLLLSPWQTRLFRKRPLSLAVIFVKTYWVPRGDIYRSVGPPSWALPFHRMHLRHCLRAPSTSPTSLP